MKTTDRFIIVVGIDFSEQADQALDAALEEASRREHAEVHVVHVEPDPWIGAGSRHQAMGADTTVEVVHQHTLEHLERMSDAKRPQRVVAHYRHGSPAEGIARLAADLGAALVVVGSHGGGGATPLGGSVAARIGALARCAVRVVPVAGHPVGRAAPAAPGCAPPSGAHRRSCASNGVHAAEMTIYERATAEERAPRP